MEERRYLITGSRDFSDNLLVERVITEIVLEGHKLGERTIIVHGACPTGADAYADVTAKRLAGRGYDVVIEAHPADWSGGRGAMVALGAYRCIAFWDGESPGTLNAIREAVRARILVVIRAPGSTA